MSNKESKRYLVMGYGGTLKNYRLRTEFEQVVNRHFEKPLESLEEAERLAATANRGLKHTTGENPTFGFWIEEEGKTPYKLPTARTGEVGKKYNWNENEEVRTTVNEILEIFEADETLPTFLMISKNGDPIIIAGKEGGGEIRIGITRTHGARVFELSPDRSLIDFEKVDEISEIELINGGVAMQGVDQKDETFSIVVDRKLGIYANSVPLEKAKLLAGLVLKPL